ncbi:hypothetical protein D3C76_1754750 [compost metagenome]
MSAKIAVLITTAPDDTLQRLQRGGFAVFVHKAVQRSNQLLNIRLRLVKLLA